MSKTGPLDFEATIDARTFNAMLDEMERRIKGTATTVVNEGEKIDETFRNIAAGITAYFGANLIGDLTSQMTQIRGEFQQLEISFETMLKNKALSDKLMAEVVQFAAKTPFDLQQVATGAKQLLAYGTQSTEVVKTMRQLGDVAAGLSIPFGELVYLYGTSATQGKLMTKDLMQFAGRGIPIIDELSKTLQVSKSRVLELASEGKIGFTDLQEVISNLTSEAGMFAGMMEKQAASIPGLLSNMGDAWDQMMNDIGKANQGTIEEVIKTATSAVENYQRVLDILKVVVATYGSYRAAVMLNTVAMNGFSNALGLAAIKLQVLNVLQKANPWGLALASITALAGGLWAYNRALDDTGKRLQEFSSQTSDAVAESNTLFDRLKKTNIGTQEREAAIRKLESIHGDYIRNLNLEKAALADIEIAQKAANDEMVLGMAIKAADDEKQQWYKKELDIIKMITEAGFDFNKVIDDRGFQNNDSGGSVFVSYGQQIDALLANYDFIQEQKKKIDETYNKIIEGFGTGILPPTVVEDTTEKSKQTLAQKLKEIQQMYENYYRWVERYGKESADKQFANLVKGGQSYLEYLERQIKTLESKPVKSDKDVTDLSTFLGAKDDLTGAKTRIELFEEEVDSAKEKYTDLVDYINYLKSSLLAVGAFDGSELSFEKIRILYEKLTQAERDFIKESANTYQKAIEEAAGFAEKRILIEKEYAAEVKKLDPVSLGDEKYAEAIAALEKIKKEKLYEVLKNEVEATEAYKKLTNDFERLTAGEASRYLGLLKEQLATLQDQPEIYNQILSLISEIEGKLANTKARNVSEVLSESARLLDIVISQLDGVDESFLAIASSISKVVGELSTVSESFAKNSATGKASNPLQGFSSLAGIFFTIADGLDKQFGMQKKIADVEEARAEYNRQLALNIETITSELDKQLSALDNMSVGAGYNASLSALQNTINGVSEDLKNLKFSLDKGPKNIDTQFDIDFLKAVYKTQDAAVALREAFTVGMISQEQYDLAMQYLNTIEGAQERIKQLNEDLKNEIIGGLADSLADELIEGFIAGKRAASDFADSFEEVMKQALINAFAVKALMPRLEWLMDIFWGMSNDADGFTAADAKNWQALLGMVTEQSSKEWDMVSQLIESVTGKPLGNATDYNSLSGQVKGVTEETAGLLVGQINAMRINQAHALDLMDEQLTYQMEIAANTRYNRKLDLLPQILNELRKGSSNPSTTIRANGGQ